MEINFVKCLLSVAFVILAINMCRCINNMCAKAKVVCLQVLEKPFKQLLVMGEIGFAHFSPFELTFKAKTPGPLKFNQFPCQYFVGRAWKRQTANDKVTFASATFVTN